MLVQGMRGDLVDQFSMSDEELEVFGVDWEGLQDETLLQALHRNYAQEEGTSTWHGYHGPPPNLNHMQVDLPSGLLTADQIQSLNNALQHITQNSEQAGVVNLWVTAYVHILYPQEF